MISGVFKEDLEQIASSSHIPWKTMENSTIFVTGATGVIGSLLIRVLSYVSYRHDLRLRLIAHGRNTVKGDIIAKECGAEFIRGDIRSKPLVEAVSGEIDYIFHCAAMTNSADMVSKPFDVMMTAVDGMRNVLELARLKNLKSITYLSSMEVYGQIDLEEVAESDLGYLDLSSLRSSYPESKRFSEIMCACYVATHGIPIKVARLSRIFGAGTPANDSDMRVAMQFARKAMRCENIELHTAGTSLANCCYTADAISGLITILLKGQIGETYNIANPAASMTVCRMADLVASEVCGGKIRVVVNVPGDVQKMGYAPDMRYVLNVDKLKALGWTPRYGLADMYRRMIDDWKGN